MCVNTRSHTLRLLRHGSKDYDVAIVLLRPISTHQHLGEGPSHIRVLAGHKEQSIGH